MKKVAFFGGSFNPPTNVHLHIAKKIINTLNLDEFFFVPVGNYYIKKDLIDVNHRYNMLNLMCVKEEKISVLDITLKEKEKLSAIDVFKKIEKLYENEEFEFFYVMGADNFFKIINWKDYEELVKNYKIIVVKRNNIDLDKFIEENEILFSNKNNFQFIDFEDDMWKINSTEVRNKILNNENVKEYLSSEILEYIFSNGLYLK